MATGNVVFDTLGRRVAEEDLLRVTKSTGARIQTTVNDLTPDQMGTCEVFEEKQVGNERFNLFRGCPGSKTCTLVLRGGAEQFIEEALHTETFMLAGEWVGIVGGYYAMLWVELVGVQCGKVQVSTVGGWSTGPLVQWGKAQW